MKANRQTRDNTSDEGVSPVIAVILMVAITVVLAATVYVWVSGFASDEGGPESAQVRAAGYDESGNGATDWLRLTLVRGENAPYSPAVVNVTVIDHDGDVIADYHKPGAAAGSQANSGIVCDAFSDSGPTTSAIDVSCADGDQWFEDDTNEWDAGQTLFAPCQGDGPHQVTITIRGSTILDERMDCDEIANIP